MAKNLLGVLDRVRKASSDSKQKEADFLAAQRAEQEAIEQQYRCISVAEIDQQVQEKNAELNQIREARPPLIPRAHNGDEAAKAELAALSDREVRLGIELRDLGSLRGEVAKREALARDEKLQTERNEKRRQQQAALKRLRELVVDADNNFGSLVTSLRRIRDFTASAEIAVLNEVPEIGRALTGFGGYVSGGRDIPTKTYTQAARFHGLSAFVEIAFGAHAGNQPLAGALEHLIETEQDS